jgi:hypothetical protein
VYAFGKYRPEAERPLYRLLYVYGTELTMAALKRRKRSPKGTDIQSLLCRNMGETCCATFGPKNLVCNNTDPHDSGTAGALEYSCMKGGGLGKACIEKTLKSHEATLSSLTTSLYHGEARRLKSRTATVLDKDSDDTHR